MTPVDPSVRTAARPVNKPLAADPWSQRAAWFTDNRAAIFTIIICLVGLTIGWQLFAERMEERTGRADGASNDVARIWGGPLLQPHPMIKWRRADAATAELARGEISATNVVVDLDAQYRRRGLTEYPGYETRFDGEYTFKNPATDPSFVGFTVGLPTDRNALMLRELKLLVNGVEDPDQTEYAPSQIVWTGKVDGQKTVKFQLQFKARGMTTFGYTFAPTRDGRSASESKPITAFNLVMNVTGVPGEIDFPVGSMSPTSDVASGNGRTLVWNVERLLTSFDVGIRLPDNRGANLAMEHLTRKAPAFYLLFGGALLWAFATVRRRARAMHVLALSGAYFLFFPLATYLTAYMAWPIASGVALAGITVLCIVHAARFVDRSAAVRVAVSAGFFLAVPTIAHLIPAHTGVILIVGAFIALGIGMHVIGVAARQVRDREEFEATPVAQVIASQPAAQVMP